MSHRDEFSSWLAPHFARFVAIKRACGAQYHSGARILSAFDRHVREEVPRPPLGRSALLTYLDALGHLSDRGRDNVVTVVWQAVRSLLGTEHASVLVRRDRVVLQSRSGCDSLGSCPRTRFAPC